MRVQRPREKVRKTCVLHVADLSDKQWNGTPPRSFAVDVVLQGKRISEDDHAEGAEVCSHATEFAKRPDTSRQGRRTILRHQWSMQVIAKQLSRRKCTRLLPFLRLQQTRLWLVLEARTTSLKCTTMRYSKTYCPTVRSLTSSPTINGLRAVREGHASISADGGNTVRGNGCEIQTPLENNSGWVKSARLWLQLTMMCYLTVAERSITFVAERAMSTLCI
ncbi:uncharacterized protein MYCFIDRAFT_171882 [Pseudocercospora fijiensis CIRAD86]|uniref:Uncharacterized protein n=1 Tax=Pseudocercospora fijiensis (strain CIRAD86) TaxID=383855 RepID=M3AN92_PSEFD|nr:uncharacterized protein MYCFIDRAFT_171882 [Pseudocercospora fijiensis CIRAD86]EME86076.1 hypothetical protein MYCFIDRAFT_171882 [Pseudocercospora fijiensis CIRAD86]